VRRTTGRAVTYNISEAWKEEKRRAYTWGDNTHSNEAIYSTHLHELIRVGSPDRLSIKTQRNTHRFLALEPGLAHVVEQFLALGVQHALVEHVGEKVVTEFVLVFVFKHAAGALAGPQRGAHKPQLDESVKLHLDH
jgi:flagellar biosynthesis component FlhA